jgi:hypothetical protein
VGAAVGEEGGKIPLKGLSAGLLVVNEGFQIVSDTSRGVDPGVAVSGAVVNGTIIYGSGALVEGALGLAIGGPPGAIVGLGAGILTSVIVSNKVPSNESTGNAFIRATELYATTPIPLD